MTRIVVLDGHTLNPDGDNPWEPIEALGALTVHPRTPSAQRLERARGADILLTNKTPIDAELLDALPELRFISVLATGVNVVDLDAARRRGVPVSNVPEYGTDAVAQFTFALILQLAHDCARHDAAIRDGAWSRSQDFSFWLSPQRELAGLTLGVVGYGRIGARVAELARAFKMRVLAHTRSDLPEDAHAERASSLEALLSVSDVVSLHCPLTSETRRLINAHRLSLMRHDAFLINTARGPLIDEAALARVLHAGDLGAAALDVASHEPLPLDSPLLDAPRCLLTPHMAWASRAARRRLMQTTADNISAFLEGDPIHRVA